MDNQSEIIAGRNPVMEALRSGIEITGIYIAKGSGEGVVKAIIAKASKMKIPVKEVSPVKLDNMAPGANHQGVAAVISPIGYVALSSILKKAEDRGEAPLVVVLDGIEDVHNLGAIARTAEAAGAHGIVIAKHRAAPVTTTAVKASSGALMHIPVCRVVNISRTIETLKEKGLWIAGADAEGEKAYFEADLKGPLAVVVGNEGRGIGRLVKEKCDFLVKIPMAGKMASLNASNAAAVVLFEVVRQRAGK